MRESVFRPPNTLQRLRFTIAIPVVAVFVSFFLLWITQSPKSRKINLAPNQAKSLEEAVPWIGESLAKMEISSGVAVVRTDPIGPQKGLYVVATVPFDDVVRFFGDLSAEAIEEDTGGSGRQLADDICREVGIASFGSELLAEDFVRFLGHGTDRNRNQFSFSAVYVRSASKLLFMAYGVPPKADGE
ncbi:MAG: hypothetical protein U0795_09245 [Pirellulales bacterium]